MFKKFIILAIWFTIISPCLYAQDCELLSSSENNKACVGGTVRFYANCTDLWSATYLWQVSRIGAPWENAGSDLSLDLTVTEPGKYRISLLVRDEESGFRQSFHDEITFYSTPDPPVIHLDKHDICSGGNVTLSVQNPQPGLIYSWSSDKSDFSATGQVATCYNITQNMQFFLEASNGNCSVTQTDYVSVLTSGTLVLDPVMDYHKRILNAFSPYGFLQISSTGTSKELGRLLKYTITEPNTFYLREYAENISCWAATSSGVSVTEFNYVPPVPVIDQIYAVGYNSTIMSNEDKTFVLQYADFYWVDGVNSTTILGTYTDGYKITESGTYYVRGRDRDTGTWGPTLNMHVQLLDVEAGLNWIHSRTFDGTSATIPFAESKSYFDDAGKSLQSQKKTHTENKGDFVFATQNLKDRYDRVVGLTLPAPIKEKDFRYNSAFLLNEDGDLYGPSDFDGGSTLNQPKTVGQNFNTVGWYYSGSNSIEDYVPTTLFPYARTEFYDDGTGETRRSASAGDQHYMGSQHETLSGTFPVFKELDDYLDVRKLTGLPNTISTLKNSGVQSVGRDQNGNYAVSITDKSGKTVMSARPGTVTDNVLAIPNNIVSSGNPNSPDYRLMTYFYILQAQPVSITGSTDFVVEDIVNNVKKGSGETFANPDDPEHKWPIGFYRILLHNAASTINVSYTHYFLDVSYQFYDDAGRLKSSISPNGYVQLKKNGIDYNDIDKTTYLYNHQGWLLSKTEPDAGKSDFKYRNDGKIRFSQNALQLENQTDKPGTGRFSYTNYDALGRPVESGEYIGTQTFSSALTQLEFNTQVQYTIANKQDWVRTYYDVVDADFQTTTGLPTNYIQNFVRNSVSHTMNADIHTWYSYDELGRVAWMAQKPTDLPRVFVVKYEHDFLGNVLTVSNLTYDGSGMLLDQIYHHYEYDANKRLSKAYTSLNGTDQKLRATYKYYLHGPLKRIELGDKLQGIDFVYNINGWLTQINHPDVSLDPGQDGHDNNGFQEDVFGMVLDYYENALGEIVPIAVNPNETNDPLRIHHLPNLDKITIREQFAGRGQEQLKRLLENLKHLKNGNVKPETTTEN